METQETNTADLLESAADILEQCPWGQGAHRSGTLEICAVDAINMAVLGYRDNHLYWEKVPTTDFITTATIVHKALDAVVEHAKLNTRFLHKWNDEPGRTKEDVIEAFKQTVKELRNTANPA